MDKKLIAEKLLEIKAVFLRPDEPFTWASGIRSPVYCDNRLTLSDVAVRRDVEEGLAEIIKANVPQKVRRDGHPARKTFQALRIAVNNELEARLCPLDVQHKVEVAVEELFVNVCRYAYADKDEPGKVQVRYAYGTDPSAITVELRDKGMPFDPMALDPERDSAKTGDGGLGILMARKSMDDFTYMRSGDTNVVVIKKGW